MKYECSICMQQIQIAISYQAHQHPIAQFNPRSIPILFSAAASHAASAVGDSSLRISGALPPFYPGQCRSTSLSSSIPPATRRPLEVPPVSGVPCKRRHADACQRGSRKRSNKRATCPPPCRRCSVQPHASRNGGRGNRSGLVLKRPT